MVPLKESSCRCDDGALGVAQVVIASMKPGLVVITVLGHNIPQGPQNYSLVALGNFNGSFESALNPAWDGVNYIILRPILCAGASQI